MYVVCVCSECVVVGGSASGVGDSICGSDTARSGKFSARVGAHDCSRVVGRFGVGETCSAGVDDHVGAVRAKVGVSVRSRHCLLSINRFLTYVPNRAAPAPTQSHDLPCWVAACLVRAITPHSGI